MKQVTISSKNQITLPSALLRAKKMKSGQKIFIVENGDDITLTSKSPLDQYIEKATALRDNTPAPSEIIDPLKFRQELRDEWEDR